MSKASLEYYLYVNTTWNEVVSHILERRNQNLDKHFLVGIDGVDGSGKTTFANTLVSHLVRVQENAKPYVVSIDNFHHPRDIRYRRGRDSPAGYFEDSFDYPSLQKLVLEPLGKSAGRSCEIFLKSHDLISDIKLTGEPVTLDSGSLVVLEGVFLQRPEVREYLDFAIFLDVPFEVSVRRMSERDGSSPDPSHSSLTRYIEGQLLYLQECNPRERADLLISNY